MADLFCKYFANLGPNLTVIGPNLAVKISNLKKKNFKSVLPENMLSSILIRGG